MAIPSAPLRPAHRSASHGARGTPTGASGAAWAARRGRRWQRASGEGAQCARASMSMPPRAVAPSLRQAVLARRCGGRDVPRTVLLRAATVDVTCPIDTLTDVKGPTDTLTDVKGPTDTLKDVKGPTDTLACAKGLTDTLTCAKGPTEALTDLKYSKVGRVEAQAGEGVRVGRTSRARWRQARFFTPGVAPRTAPHTTRPHPARRTRASGERQGRGSGDDRRSGRRARWRASFFRLFAPRHWMRGWWAQSLTWARQCLYDALGVSWFFQGDMCRRWANVASGARGHDDRPVDRNALPALAAMAPTSVQGAHAQAVLTAVPAAGRLGRRLYWHAYDAGASVAWLRHRAAYPVRQRLWGHPQYGVAGRPFASFVAPIVPDAVVYARPASTATHGRMHSGHNPVGPQLPPSVLFRSLWSQVYGRPLGRAVPPLPPRRPPPSMAPSTPARPKSLKHEPSSPNPLPPKPQSQDPFGLGDVNVAPQAWDQVTMDFEKAVDKATAMTENALGLHYLKVQKNPAESFKHFHEASERGYAKAQYNQGICYERGRGVTKDIGKAVACYKRAAEQGHAMAQYNLAALYHEGRGVVMNHALALIWLKRSSDQNFAPAQQALVQWMCR